MRHLLALIERAYQEEPGGTFTNDDHDYDLNGVLEDVDAFPIVLFFVRDLKWVLAFDTPDPERVHDADLHAPILVTYYGDKLVVVDGLHRLAKAVMDDKKVIRGKFVPSDVLDKNSVGARA